MRVIVAGAGLAGLTAARTIARAGGEVRVFDARPRPGGRVWTVRDGFAGGGHGELGGEFIDEEHTAIRDLCGEVGLPIVRILPGGFTHRFRDEGNGFRLSRTRPWQELETLLEPLIDRYRRARGEAAPGALREIARLSLREWLRRQGATSEQHSMADALRGFFLADPDELSVLPVIEQIARGGSPARTKVHRIEGGADRLIAALARTDGIAMHLRHRVVAIAHDSNAVRCTIHDVSGSGQQFEADFAVVTLPATTLRDVVFTPPLAEDQWRAIARLRYGPATKVLLQTCRDPLPRRAQAFATDGATGAFWKGPGRVLTFLGGGSASAALRARLSRPAALLDDLCWLGLSGDQAEAVHTTTWEDDPWARGGYAYLDPAFDPADRAALGRRAGRIVFAGEHTSERWQGYMNGAVETGRRAAQALLTS
jgi:monoamine oxidase